MGDRANFGIRHSNGDTVFIYAHWGGEGMLSRFANALKVTKAYGRLNDEAYATRIIFEQILKDAYSPDLSYGITVNELCDNEHKVPVFFVAEQKVTLFDMDRGYGFDKQVVTYNVDRFIDKYAK